MPRTHSQAPQAMNGPQLITPPNYNAGNRGECNLRLMGGLSLLLDGYSYASDLGRDRWEFALEIEFLYTAGLTNNDLRWLVAKGYVEQALETSAKGMVRRRSTRAGRRTLLEGSCFVLTDVGVQFAQVALCSPDSEMPKRRPELPSPDVPHWDAETHSLYWRGRLVKHFKHEAPFQEAILEAFEQNSWSRYVVVTLPKEEGINHKERLRDSIRNLNHRSDKRLQFSQEGNGGRVGWQPVDRKTPIVHKCNANAFLDFRKETKDDTSVPPSLR